MRQILVTYALPYANGHAHIGHLVGTIQTDIWVRFQKLRGRQCIYICGDDTHGTAVMIRARQEGVSEEQWIAEMQQSHVKDFAGFDIEFDNYGSTNSPESREACDEIWAEIRKAGLVEEREVTQLYDAKAGTFLADRFVKGTCPKCKSPGQYGDSCDKCGSHYSPTELIDPVSTLSGTTPEIRQADHLFINIEKLHGFLEEWSQHDEHLQPEIANYLKGHFLCEPLHDWDVSRPAPYFGFEIPDSPGNYWYVWFDAPIGYIGSTKQWCDKHGENLDDWWRNEEKTVIHHFIGKDITYFHTLFWPAMLKTAGLSLPEKVHIHGFLTVGGEKMSKSKGTFIRASTYLEHLDPAYLRYYYASKLSSAVDDIDLNFEDFIGKVNSDLVGKVVNIASRTARVRIRENWALADAESRWRIVRPSGARRRRNRRGLRKCDYSRAMRLIMAAADRANAYMDDRGRGNWPRRTIPSTRACTSRCTTGLNLFRQLAIYLAPVLPRLAEADRRTVGRSDHQLGASEAAAPGHAGRKVLAHDEAGRSEAGRGDGGRQRRAGRGRNLRRNAALRHRRSAGGRAAGRNRQLRRFRQGRSPRGARDRSRGRAGRAKTAETHARPRRRQPPHRLRRHQGRLQARGSGRPAGDLRGQSRPRKMKFGLSEGMIVAAGGGGGEIYLLSPDEGAKPGQRVH